MLSKIIKLNRKYRQVHMFFLLLILADVSASEIELNSKVSEIKGVENIYKADMPSLRGAEYGVKVGAQLYDNNLGSPVSFSYGVFLNTPLTENFSFESEFLTLGKGEEDNGNVGAFHMAALSGMYHYDLNSNQQFFVKAGAAPWFGYTDLLNNDRIQDWGVSPTFGVGFRFPLFDHIFGRLEYQFTPNLGSNNIGRTDSHLLSMSLTWRNTASSRKHVEATVKPKEPKGVHVTESGNSSIAYHELSGSMYFNIDSSYLTQNSLSASFDKGVALVKQGCSLTSADVQGYADNTGTARYNMWLSIKRAQNVASSIQSIFGETIDISVRGHGNLQLSNAPAFSDIHDRRVDYKLNYFCSKG